MARAKEDDDGPGRRDSDHGDNLFWPRSGGGGAWLHLGMAPVSSGVCNTTSENNGCGIDQCNGTHTTQLLRGLSPLKFT